MVDPVSAALAFLIAFGVTAGVTPLVRAVARARGQVARPRADRWSQQPTALLGGIAMAAGLAAAFAWVAPGGGRPLLLWAGCGAAMFALGLVDDLTELRPAAKLAGQIAIAALFTAAGPHLRYTFLPVVDFGITVLWLVGITNALNLLDNLDGQAAGVTAIAAGFLAYFFLEAGQPLQAALALAVAGAALGFLLYNFHPASIFMGDSGSLLLGFALASLSLLAPSHRTRNLLATLAVPILILLVPIIDTTLVTLSRKAHGRAVSQGGTDHISHRLVALGLSERGTVAVVYATAVLSGLVAIGVRYLSFRLALALIPVFLGLVIFGLLVLGRVRVYGGPGAAAPTPDRPTRTVLHAIGLGQRRQIFLALFDLMAVLFAYHVAFVIRFGEDPRPFAASFQQSLPVVVSVQMALLWLTGAYRPLLDHAGISDLARVAGSAVLAVAGSVAAATFVFRFSLLSRVAFALDALLLAVVLVAGRLVGRAATRLSQRQQARVQRRALIYGAGGAGAAAVRELRENAAWDLRPVGWIDDDPGKWGRRLAGLPVLGGPDALRGAPLPRAAEAVLLAIRDLPAERLEALTEACARAGIPLLRFRLDVEPVAPAPAPPRTDAP
jgi:UDP-GlcNAc:undecaprenyl-phosphate GlcNAc-1-phosphate transferase